MKNALLAIIALGVVMVAWIAWQDHQRQETAPAAEVSAARPMTATPTQPPPPPPDPEAQTLAPGVSQSAGVATLRSLLEQSQREAAYWKGEAARYQKGAEACVAALNAAGGAARSSAPATTAQPSGRARIVTYDAPTVQLLQDQVLVTGKLWNSGTADADGELIIELVHNGEVVERQDQHFFCAAGSDYAWSQSFRAWGDSSGTWSARATPRY